MGSSEILRPSRAKHAGTHVQCLLKRFFLFPAQKIILVQDSLLCTHLDGWAFSLSENYFFSQGEEGFPFIKRPPWKDGHSSSFACLDSLSRLRLLRFASIFPHLSLQYFLFVRDLVTEKNFSHVGFAHLRNM